MHIFQRHYHGWESVWCISIVPMRESDARASKQALECQTPNWNRYAVWRAAQIAFYAPKCGIPLANYRHTGFRCIVRAHNNWMDAACCCKDICSNARSRFVSPSSFIPRNTTDTGAIHAYKVHCKNLYYSLIWYLIIPLSGWEANMDFVPHFNFSN